MLANRGLTGNMHNAAGFCVLHFLSRSLVVSCATAVSGARGFRVQWGKNSRHQQYPGATWRQ